jgi:hypothetical protein
MCSGQKLLQTEKCLLTLRAPFKLGVRLYELGHGLDDLGKVGNESVIISYQSDEATDLHYRSYRLPIQHLLNLTGVDCNTLR